MHSIGIKVKQNCGDCTDFFPANNKKNVLLDPYMYTSILICKIFPCLFYNLNIICTSCFVGATSLALTHLTSLIKLGTKLGMKDVYCIMPTEA